WALPGREAHIERNGTAGQPGRLVRCEENSQISYVGRLAEAAQRNCGEAIPFHFCSIRRIEEFADEVRFHDRRADAIDANIFVAMIDGDSFRQQRYATR